MLLEVGIGNRLQVTDFSDSDATETEAQFAGLGARAARQADLALISDLTNGG
jgi:hypothetical protein